MQLGEDPVTAAIREVREETSLTTELADLIGIYTMDRSYIRAAGVGFAFRGKIKSGEIRLQENEVNGWGFYTPDEIAGLVALDLIYKPEYATSILEDWVRGGRVTH